jgi:hypothetical protein
MVDPLGGDTRESEGAHHQRKKMSMVGPLGGATEESESAHYQR